MRTAGASTSRAVVLRAMCVAGAIALAGAAPAFAQEASPAAAPSPAASSSSAAPIAEAPIAEPEAAPTAPAASAPVAEVAPAVALPATPASPAGSEPPDADASGAGLPPPNPAETPIATLPPNLRALVADHPAQAPSTAEIPPATAQGPAAAQEPLTGTVDAQPDSTDPEILNYEREQQGISNPAQMQYLRDFLSQGSLSSPMGVELREARRRLASGEEADGLLVIRVQAGSPAALAGLHGFHRGVHTAVTAAAIAAAYVFWPAMFVLPVLEYTQVGESYDLIIGVDGSRVSNFLDFQDRMREVRGGELVYLSVVRDGHRKQITVKVPTDMVNLAW
jgi:hypothetical protein